MKLTGSIDRLQLQRAIDKLPRDTDNFVLHDVEGFEHNEIAEMVGARSVTASRSSTKQD